MTTVEREEREFDRLRSMIKKRLKKRYDMGEITKESYEEGLLLIRQVKTYLDCGVGVKCKNLAGEETKWEEKRS